MPNNTDSTNKMQASRQDIYRALLEAYAPPVPQGSTTTYIPVRNPIPTTVYNPQVQEPRVPIPATVYNPTVFTPTPQQQIPNPMADPMLEQLVQYGMQNQEMYRAPTGRPTFPVPEPPPVFNPFASRIAEEYGQRKKNNKR